MKITPYTFSGIVAILAIMIATFFFDKALLVGLCLLVFLSCLTFLVFYKIGFGDKKIYLLFFIVLALHLATTLFMYYGHFQPFSGGAGDYIYYQQNAQMISARLHQGNFSVQGVTLHSYYPLIIGYLYALTMPSQIIGLMLNVWLVALAITLIYLIVLEIGGSKKNAFIIGLIVALYPSYIFNTGLLLKDALEICFIMLALLLLLKTIKKCKWYHFLSFYVVLICVTQFRFYIGYVLMFTFLVSWFLIANISIKKRVVYGILFIIILGFVPQITTSYGYYGIGSVEKYLNYKSINFYRTVVYNPAHYSQAPPVGPALSSLPAVVLASKPHVQTNSVLVNAPVSKPSSVVGLDSSFVVGNGPTGYIKSFFYAMLGPFPWQIKKTRQLFALIETFPWYLLLFFVVDGMIVVYRKRVKIALPLVLFSFMTLVIIAIFDSNFGEITRIRIPVFMALLCIASFGFREDNIIYRFVNTSYEKILSYGRSWFHRQPLSRYINRAK